VNPVAPPFVDAAASQAWLRLCLVGRHHAAALDEARALLPGVDWEETRTTIWSERLAPLVYKVVRATALAPSDLEEELARAYEENVLRNTFLFHRLEELLLALHDAGIDALLLKGAALSHAIYGRSAVRPMGDLDVLVRPEQARAALDALTRIGYSRCDAEPHAGDTLVYEVESALWKPGPIPTLLEIHWGLLDSPHYQRVLDMAWFWRTALPVRIGGADTLILGAEAQLLHLCAHLTLHHAGEGVLWRHDIAEVVHAYRERLDWGLLLAQAQAFDLVLPVQGLLKEIAAQWQAPIPGEILQRLADLRPSPAEVRVYTRLTVPARPVAQRFYADLASMPGWRPRLRYALTNLLPSPAYMRQRYGFRQAWLLPLFYLYRYTLGIRSLVRRQP